MSSGEARRLPVDLFDHVYFGVPREAARENWLKNHQSDMPISGLD
jgi:SpoVK/Ycf46/Vps4 family AAA+-type ATPase